jgi:septum formation protein
MGAAFPFIYLASASPRRRELLNQIGVPHQLIPVQVPEIHEPHEVPDTYVARLATAKARAGFYALEKQGLALSPVMGADTIGVLDQKILEKPRDKQHFLAMLSSMSGRSHFVKTAVSVCFPADKDIQQITLTATTEVFFREIHPCELEAYWQTGEPQDKAGGYGIQGLGAVFVEKIIGSYSNVVGLPIEICYDLLSRINGPVWQIQSRNT